MKPTTVLQHMLKIAADSVVKDPVIAPKFDKAVKATVGGKPATDLQLAKVPKTVFGMRTATGRSLDGAEDFRARPNTRLPRNAHSSYIKAIAGVDGSEGSPYRHGTGTSTSTLGGRVTTTNQRGERQVVELPQTVVKTKYGLGMDGITGEPVELSDSKTPGRIYADTNEEDLRDRLVAPNAGLLPHHGG